LDSQFVEKMKYFRSNENIIVNHNDVKLNMQNSKRKKDGNKTLKPTSLQNSKKLEIEKTPNGNQFFKNEHQNNKIKKEARNIMSQPLKI